MDSPVATRSPWPLALAVCFGLLVTITIGGYEFYFKTAFLEGGDLAVNALQIDNARHGHEIYGNYSRFVFYHPGPVFFYVYAAGEQFIYHWFGLVPSPHTADLLTSLFLQVSFFAVAIAVIHCWIDSWTFVAGALLGGVWHFSLAHGAFTSIWPPHVLLMPFLAFLAAVSSFAAGRTRDLGVAAVAGGFLFHGHVAQSMFVGGLGVVAAFLHFRGLRVAGKWTGWRHWLSTNRGLVWFCVLWTGLLLLPLAVDVARYRGLSNVSVIAHQFLANTQDRKSIQQSLLYFFSFLAYAGNQEDLFTKLSPESFRFFREHLVVLSCWLSLLSGSIVLAWRSREKLPEKVRRFFGAAYPLWIVTALLCVAWGTMQAGAMHQFNGFFYFGVWYFAGVLGLGAICSLPRVSFPLPVAAGLCGVAVIGAGWLFRASGQSPEDTGAIVLAGVKAVLQKNPGHRPKLLVFEHYAWPKVAMVALALERQGISVYVSPAWNFMFGRRHDSSQLGPNPEKSADVWWITHNGPGGQAISNDLQIFTQAAPLDPRNTELKVTDPANSFRYLITGLSPGNLTDAWSDQKRTAFEFRPVPATENIRVVFDAAANCGSAMPAEVLFNGQSLGKVAVNGRSGIPVTIPKDLWNSSPTAVLELRYPEASRFDYFPLAASNLWYAWRFWKISFASAPSG